MSEEATEETEIAQEPAEDKATFEELCAMLKRGMEDEQALSWAMKNGLVITEEQRTYLERELGVFDAELLVEPHEEAEPEPVPVPEKPKKPEPKKLTATEKRNAILGILIVLSVLIALRRFLFG